MIPAMHDLEARARWHLELGYEQDGELPPGVIYTEDDDYDQDDGFSCTHCGGEGWGPVDDPLWDTCDEFGYGPCGSCHGTGERRHQWVF